MINKMNKRNKFFLRHLSVSICLALIIVGWVFLIWYPQPLAKAVGVTHIFIMMLIIDVIVGPILSFVIYKEKKKSLKFDLSIIIAIQILALGYGMFNIAQARPIWIVFNQNKFELIQKNYLILDNVPIANEKYKTISPFVPLYVGVEPSIDKQQRNNNNLDFLISGISLAQRPELYIPLDKIRIKMSNQSMNLRDLTKFNNQNEVGVILSKNPQATAWLPLKANAADMVVLINKEKGEVVKIVDLRPWK